MNLNDLEKEVRELDSYKNKVIKDAKLEVKTINKNIENKRQQFLRSFNLNEFVWRLSFIRMQLDEGSEEIPHSFDYNSESPFTFLKEGKVEFSSPSKIVGSEPPLCTSVDLDDINIGVGFKNSIVISIDLKDLHEVVKNRNLQLNWSPLKKFIERCEENIISVRKGVNVFNHLTDLPLDEKDPYYNLSSKKWKVTRVGNLGWKDRTYNFDDNMDFELTSIKNISFFHDNKTERNNSTLKIYRMGDCGGVVKLSGKVKDFRKFFEGIRLDIDWSNVNDLCDKCEKRLDTVKEGYERLHKVGAS